MMRALRVFEEDLQAHLAEHGFADVTLGQTNLLRHLDASGMRLGELAVDAGVTKQAVTVGVRGLVARDLVELVPDPEDGRARRVVYTNRGQRLIAAAVTQVVSTEARWREQLGEDGYNALRRTLSTLGER